MKWPLTATCLLAIGLGVAGCGGSGKHAAGTTTSLRACCSAVKTTTSGYGVGVSPKTTLTQIAAARRSEGLFKLFPARTASVSCRIPRGGPYSPGKMMLPGTCSTRVGYTQGPQAAVVFTETWIVPCYGSGNCRTKRHHTWEIVVSSTGKVLSVVSRGAPPPQLWS